MSRRAFKPTAEQRRWVEAMIGYGIPEAEIRLLIKHPQTGKLISLETFRRQFAEEIASGSVKVKALIGERIVGSILGRERSPRRPGASHAGYTLCQGLDGLDHNKPPPARPSSYRLRGCGAGARC